MLKALIFGGGNMGIPLAHAMLKFGFHVLISDPDRQTVVWNLQQHKVFVDDVLDGLEEDSLETIKRNKPDIVISAAPYDQNYYIAQFCLERGFRYCDLGGNPTSSEEIAKLCRQHKGVAFTDLGLAPGLVNILVENLYQKYSKTESIYSVKLMVGGLPTNSNIGGSLKYGLSWSVDGLWNEYFGECKVLESGEIIPKKALEGYEPVYLNQSYQLEAFYTKGGIGSTLELMKNRGVKKCSYKTLRYTGHHQFINFLIKECKVDKYTFTRLIHNCCPQIKQDLVYIIIDINNHRSIYTIRHDETWTAMQKATAFSAAAVARIMAEGELDGKKENLNYSDIPFGEFSYNLKKLDFPIIEI